MADILIIEDDVSLSNGISLALKDGSTAFSQAFDAAQARERIKTGKFDLIILDINLPDGNGLGLLAEIRKTSSVPVIILTANDMETDIVTGLEMGADDYITKPFSLMILRARVNAQLRKSVRKMPDTVLIDHFSFHFGKMEFLVKGRPVELSRTEQKLLMILLENMGITVAKSRLIDHIWSDGAEYVDENALSVTVKRLRDKLEDTPSAPKFIKNVYGIGYVWAVK